MRYPRSFSHIGLSVPNLEEAVKFYKEVMGWYVVMEPSEVVEHGGKQRMPIREYYPDEKPYRMCYVEDLFGIIFEVYSHSYEVTYSSGAY